MIIKLEPGHSIDVEPGRYVYDELTDTWITWDLLDEPTKLHLEILVQEAERTAAAMRGAIVNAVKLITTGQDNILAS